MPEHPRAPATGRCQRCGKESVLRRDGRIRRHKRHGWSTVETCPGSDGLPATGDRCCIMCGAFWDQKSIRHVRCPRCGAVDEGLERRARAGRVG